MVHFLCQLDWAHRIPRHVIKHYSIWLWGSCWMKSTFELLDQWKKTALLNKMQLIQSTEDTNTTTDKREWSCLTASSSLSLVLRMLAFRLELRLSALLVFTPFNLYWNYTIGSLGSPLADYRSWDFASFIIVWANSS